MSRKILTIAIKKILNTTVQKVTKELKTGVSLSWFRLKI